jgi:hypothetical protein
MLRDALQSSNPEDIDTVLVEEADEYEKSPLREEA